MYDDQEKSSWMAGEALSKDIAVGGLAFYHQTAIQPGEVVALRCHLPEKAAIARFFAEVVRCDNVDPGPYLIGVKLLHYRKADFDLLADYLVDFWTGT